MLTKRRLSSVQLAVTLFLCGTAVIILQNFYSKTENSFLQTVFSSIISTAVMLLLALPALEIRRKTGKDFITFAQERTPNAAILISAVFCLYFVYVAVYFINFYVQMLMEKINPLANAYVFALLLIAVCVYGAYKGINAVTRCAIFIFAFAVLAYILIFCSNISNLDFSTVNFYEFGKSSDFFKESASLSALGVVSIIYGCTAGKTKKFSPKHFAFLVLSLLVLVLISQFFVYFVLGNFGKERDFQFFTLARTAKIGDMNGLDGIYLALSTSVMFVLISILLICMNRSAAKSCNLKMSLIFGAIIFALYICSQTSGFCQKVLSNPYVFLAFTILCAAIEILYMLFVRRFNYAEEDFVRDIYDADSV